MHYLNSQLLYLAPILAVAAVALVLLNYQRKQAAQKAFGDWDLLSKTSKPLPRSRYLARSGLAAAAVVCLVVALARPVIPDGTKVISQGTVSVMAVIDVSRSMAAMDYDGKVPSSAVAGKLIDDGTKAPANKEDAGTRLEMVRHIMLDSLLPAVRDNQLGIVSYAGKAFPQAFLTRDGKALHWVIDRGLTISSAPGEGSDIGSALELAMAMFDADAPPEHEKLLVLFSDGGNTTEDASRLTEFVRQARQRHVTVIVVAIGNVMPAKIPLSKLASDDDHAKALIDSGKRWYELNGQVEKTGMDAPFLQSLANQSGGQFIHLQNASDLNLVDHVGKTALTSVDGTQELFPWALLAALTFLVLAFAVTRQWSRRQ